MNVELDVWAQGITAWLQPRGVSITVEDETLTLMGQEIDIVRFLETVADVYDYTLSKRDPGPVMEPEKVDELLDALHEVLPETDWDRLKAELGKF